MFTLAVRDKQCTKMQFHQRQSLEKKDQNWENSWIRLCYNYQSDPNYDFQIAKIHSKGKITSLIVLMTEVH